MATKWQCHAALDKHAGSTLEKTFVEPLPTSTHLYRGSPTANVLFQNVTKQILRFWLRGWAASADAFAFSRTSQTISRRWINASET